MRPILGTALNVFLPPAFERSVSPSGPETTVQGGNKALGPAAADPNNPSRDMVKMG